MDPSVLFFLFLLENVLQKKSIIDKLHPMFVLQSKKRHKPIKTIYIFFQKDAHKIQKYT